MSSSFCELFQILRKKWLSFPAWLVNDVGYKRKRNSFNPGDLEERPIFQSSQPVSKFFIFSNPRFGKGRMGERGRI
jgi:hypothetical protein